MNTLFLTALIIETIFGLGFIFIPAKMLGPYGVILNETAATFARLFGSAILCFPVLLWFARKSENMDFKKAAVYTLLFYFLISGIILVIAQTAGLMNVLGWAIVGLHVLFVIWFGYYAVKQN
ncbi:MAG TPA: hypothetical protein ENO27_04150 [Caldithrix sp.]|nr:hypothetical protein [Calditrichaceae bacterium]HEM49386.1 hypothetical protein [Caldithrix sp.]